jgi:hypothetical protein
MTELETLKKKKKDSKATPEDLTRLKVLIDGEPLSASDLEAAKQREADTLEVDKAKFAAKHKVADVGQAVDPELDIPAEHPRIAALKAALAPFTQIEAHDSRPDEFVLFVRGTTITAGMVRAACKAMNL